MQLTLIYRVGQKPPQLFLDKLCDNVNQSINQSKFLEWPKWHCHCKVYCRLNVNVSNKSQETIGRIDVVSAFSGTWQRLGGDNVVG